MAKFENMFLKEPPEAETKKRNLCSVQNILKNELRIATEIA